METTLHSRSRLQRHFFFKPRQSKQDKTKNSCWDSLRRSIRATPESRQLQNQFVGLAGASQPRQPIHAKPKIFGMELDCNLQSRRRIPGMAQTVTPLATPEGDLPHALRRAYGGRKKSRVPFLSQILRGKHNKNYRISLRDLPSSPLYGDASPFPKTNCFKDRS